MMRCPVCQAAIPEVHGAEVQLCAKCGAEVPVARPAPAPPPARRRDTARAARRAVATVARDYGAWLAFYAPLAVLGLAVELLGIGAARLVGYDGTALPTDPITVALLVVVALPFELLRDGLGAAFLGLGAALTADALEQGGRARPFDGLRRLRERPGPLLGAGVVYAAVLYAGMFLLVVPMFFFLHWYLWTTAFVARGKEPGEAFRASRDLARTPGMKAYTLLVVLAWLAVALARFAGGAALGPLLGGSDLAVAVAGALVTLPLLPLVPALVGSLLVESTGETAPAAAAARTVACPGCGTPLGYVPDGNPQRLTCPICGRSGIVR